MSNKARENVVTRNGYDPRKAGYTPPESSSDSKNIRLPKGGSGASGQPHASLGQNGNAQGGSGIGAKK
jgi:hypothetical protein